MHTLTIDGEEYRIHGAVVIAEVGPDGKFTPAGSANNSTVVTGPTSGTKTVAAAATPEALTATDTLVESVEIINDTGSDIFVGDATAQPKKVATGTSWAIEAPKGKKLNLKLIFVKVSNNGDVVKFLKVN